MSFQADLEETLPVSFCLLPRARMACAVSLHLNASRSGKITLSLSGGWPIFFLISWNLPFLVTPSVCAWPPTFFPDMMCD